MKLYYIRQEILEDLKNNIANNIEKYQDDTNQWILEIYEDPFLEYKKESDDFDLIINPADVGTSDIENIKVLHSNLNFLTKTEAAEERLWAGLAHSVFWGFMIKRWERSPTIDAKQVANRYFLDGGSSNRRALLMNTISRYWWIGELIYDDENKEDPYYLIEAFKGDFITNVHTFLSSNFTSNPKLVRGVLRPILEYEKNNMAMSREEFRAVIRHANLIGGSYLLDYLTADEIERKIEFFIANTFEDRIKVKDAVERDSIDAQSDAKGKKGVFSKFRDTFLGKNK